VIEIILLSFIQGLTEFIPVSSSSHLILVSEYLNFDNKNLSIDVSLHIGSFFAVLFYFKKEVLNFIKYKELFLKILVSSIPVIILGFILVKSNAIDALRDVRIIGLTTIIFGLLLFFSDRLETKKDMNKNFDYKSAIIIGILQILSLIPGVSRSGISITAARFLNFKRSDSAKISFLLSLPTLAAVSIYGLKNIFLSENLNYSTINLIAILLSGIFSYLTIKYFLIYLKKFNLNLFVIYRIILGILILSFNL
tara:strand:- start:1128 stop:1883 length:756 start_codon:yes stop_codon:yes gene_type:complete